MKIWLPLAHITESTPVSEVGGKAKALASLQRSGLRVPHGGCIPTDVYTEVVRAQGFQERLEMELNRKPFADMRWEELWDAALRIRNWFLQLQLPTDLSDGLAQRLHDEFGDAPVAVRSSAPAEDSEQSSFAGLHESYVDTSGVDAILHHVRLVWASLWSDRALLYRQELGLNVRESTMAVVVQVFIDGRPSGVAFSQNPMDASQGVIEGVMGRGEDFVDGAKAPDRWLIERGSGAILAREKAPDSEALCLNDSRVAEIFGVVHDLELVRGTPQDMEWTLWQDDLHVLQARTITATAGADANAQDKRPWYLTLTRSLPELRRLHITITNEVLPDMESDTARFRAEDLSQLSDDDLAGSIKERQQSVKHWLDAYWEYCIPFAHGMRLFGQIYNDRLQPEDPHEFLRLLAGSQLISLERNEKLRALGIRFMEEELADSPTLLADLDAYIQRYAEHLLLHRDQHEARQLVLDIARQLAQLEMQAQPQTQDRKDLKKRFFAAFPGEERTFAEELLGLGQASYTLRDNDNHYLDRVQTEASRALAEASRRIDAGHIFSAELMQANLEPNTSDEVAATQPKGEPPAAGLRGKQLKGQPSSPGIATGLARVLLDERDLLAVQRGEVLVCDAISPAMTFVVPLVAAIVERRGGMLIHGAIIAREYGIPCVTGVARATELITTGQTVSVDGHLGLIAVRVEEGEVHSS